jgi:4-amino-4-deoxy-L-arabinose transferase-like glycosyltransferase
MKKLKGVLFLAIIFVAACVRFYHLNQVPPSLYWEEAALGYDAYSILKTGKDHHGQTLPLVAFTSFGDYKPAGYFYALVPAILFFGLNEFAVRFPSAFAGVLLVIVIGLLSRRFVPKKEKETIQLISMAITTVSPWAIQFSRGGWEVNVATCLLTWGVYLGLLVYEDGEKWKRLKNFVMVIFSFLLLGLSMYTYHAARLIAPVLALGLLFVWLCRSIDLSSFSLSKITELIKSNSKILFSLFVSGLFFLFLISPLLLAAKDPSTQQRFAETSLFADGRAVTLSNYYRELAGNSLASRLIYHRFVFSAQIFIQNYLKHFSPQFLFVSGDENVRHSVQFFGLFYLSDVLFLSCGLFYFFKNRAKDFWFYVMWFLIGIVPAALTQAAPHALRTLPVMPVYMILISLGVTRVLNAECIKNLKIVQRLLMLFIMLVIAIQFLAFWRFYIHIYPKIYGGEWQYGYQQMVTSVAAARAQNPSLPVYITREYGRPAMYYWFYTQTDPRRVQAENATALKDQGEFLMFENIHFVRSANEVKQGIVAVSPAGMSQLQSQYKHIQVLNEVKDLHNQTVWMIANVE